MDDAASILIVDSNAGFARMLKESLEQAGDYEATVASTGREALTIASETSFDLAIVDLGIDPLGNLDGETVARRLRAGQSGLRLMLIPLEGDTLPEELGDLDVQGTLSKPFFLPDLPELLDDALTRPLKEGEEQLQVPEPDAQEMEPAVDGEPEEVLYTLSPRADRELEILARDINADAVLVTRAGHVLAGAGQLSSENLQALADTISRAYHLSRETAAVLGREQTHFEQSVESDEYMLYSLSIAREMLLSAVLPPDVTLGLLRHQMKRAARRLHGLVEE